MSRLSVHGGSEMTLKRELSWAFLLPALVVPTLGSLIYFVWIPEGTVGKAAYSATKFFTLLYPFLFLKWVGLGGLTRREERKTSWPAWKTVILTGLGSGVAIVVVGLLLMMTPLGAMVRDGAGAVSEKAEGLGFKDHFILFAVFVSVFHSALEEFYWRWFVYSHLREKVGRWAGHVIAAVGFGGHHLVITLQFFPPALAIFLTLCVVVGGFIWTLMYERQGTVVGCWVSHLCVDVLLMVIGFQLIMGGG
ncbi:MAG: CPBP family intramembrane glutamic endopeptidase [Roseibacillus sp.]